MKGEFKEGIFISQWIVRNCMVEKIIAHVRPLTVTAREKFRIRSDVSAVYVMKCGHVLRSCGIAQLLMACHMGYGNTHKKII